MKDCAAPEPRQDPVPRHPTDGSPPTPPEAPLVRPLPLGPSRPSCMPLHALEGGPGPQDRLGLALGSGFPSAQAPSSVRPSQRGHCVAVKRAGGAGAPGGRRPGSSCGPRPPVRSFLLPPTPPALGSAPAGGGRPSATPTQHPARPGLPGPSGAAWYRPLPTQVRASNAVAERTRGRCLRCPGGD